jgi:hypothetical protein
MLCGLERARRSVPKGPVTASPSRYNTYAETNYANPHALTGYFNGNATTTYSHDNNGNLASAHRCGDEHLHLGLSQPHDFSVGE